MRSLLPPGVAESIRYQYGYNMVHITVCNWKKRSPSSISRIFGRRRDPEIDGDLALFSFYIHTQTYEAPRTAVEAASFRVQSYMPSCSQISTRKSTISFKA